MPRFLPRTILCCCLLLVLPTVQVLAVNAVGAGYRGNVQSRVFHAATCRYFTCKNCTAEFAVRAQALKAGFRPCTVCRP